MNHTRIPTAVLVAAACIAGCGTETPETVDAGRPRLWVDLLFGEPVSFDAVVDDLASARVVYLGERHRLARHHAIQARIVAALADRGAKPAVAMEQLEADQQPVVDRYNRGEIDFAALVDQSQWEQRWSGCRQYRGVVAAARAAGAPVVAINAPKEIIRAVARGGGVEKLDPDTRALLPDRIVTDDPAYRTLLGLYLPAHTAAARMMEGMTEAQIARDEAMAENLCRFLRSDAGRGRTAVVILGSGHCSYGLGTPDRVRRRIPGITDRIVLMSESGDVVLTEHEKSVSRKIEVTHEQVRVIGRPVADYLHVTAPKRD